MKSNFIKYIFFIFVIGIMVFAIYTVTKQEKDKAKEVEETEIANKNVEEKVIKEITLGIAEFDTINPILSGNKYVQEISKIIYDPLLEVDGEYKIQKKLAKDWAKTSGETYLVKVRDDIKWSDGEKFTADDVIFTIDVLKQIPSIYAYNVQYVVNAEKVDKDTIKITLDHEIPFFEYNLIFPIMSKKFYEQQDFSNTEKNNMPVGTGKYKITRNDAEGLTLEKNEYYKDGELTLDSITIGKYSNLGELYNAFKLGKVDVLSTDNIKIADNIGNMGYNINETMGRDFDFLALNTSNAVLADKEVRRAIKYAINKEGIVVSLFNGKYKVQNYPLDFGSYLKGEPGDNEYSIEKARQTLETAGWVYKNDRWQKTERYNTKAINLRLVVQANNTARVAVAEMIRANLEEAGIRVSIIQANDSQYENYLNSKNYDMLITGIRQSGSPNLEAFFGGGNLSNYNNAEVNTIMNEVKNISKEDLLLEKYKRLRQIYNDETPYIGLYNNYYAIMSDWDLKGNITANWYNIFMYIDDWYKN